MVSNQDASGRSWGGGGQPGGIGRERGIYVKVEEYGIFER